MDYRPDIDGLRAVAVAAVVAVHVLPTALPGGYVGVDIFFVISGFLITAISLHRIEAGRFSFQDFYARRARRLLPALFVLLSGTGLVGSLLYDGATLADLGASTAAAVLFVANIHDYGTVDYFTAPAETRPLLHLWSLGVEEQFYLLAPWLLVGLARRPRALAAATVAMVLGSLGLGIAVLELDPPAAFYLLPCRAWEVGLGMLLALAPKGWRAPRGSGLLGLLLIGIAVVGFDEHTPVSTHSTPGASWAFSFQQIADAGGMLVTRMNGEPLPADHGQPVRLMMPGWYGCCCAKWVDEIRLVDDGEPATAQMQEFASRTHQPGIPALCKDYLAATMDQAAMVTRVEKWMVDGAIRYRLVGIMWGGYETTDALMMEIGNHDTGPVEVCPAHSQNKTWTLWSTAWDPPEPGQYAFSMRIDDPAITTKRLDSNFYTRQVIIDEV